MSSPEESSELESLRAQVAALSRKLAEQDQPIQGLCAQSHLQRLTQFAVDHAGDALFWADETERFVYVNEAACRSLGYTREELLTLRIPDIAPQHDPERFQDRLASVGQGLSVRYESLYRRKDGTEFPIEASVAYLKHEGRSYICGIVRDITERKGFEQERTQTLQNLRNIIETVPDFMFTLDCQGNMVNWNRHVVDVTGYSQEELFNKPAVALVPPEEGAAAAVAIQQAFTEGYAEFNGHLLTKDRRTISYHWTGAQLKNPQGEPIGITGVGRDVSSKKRMEQALIASEAKFRSTINASPVPMALNDDALRIIYLNPAFTQMFGYGLEEIPTLAHWWPLAYPDPVYRSWVVAVWQEELARTKRTGTPFSPLELTVRCKDGTSRIVLASAAPLQEGFEGAHLVVLIDTTERKQAAEALRESERYSRQLFDLSPLGLALCRVDGTLVDINEAFARILGRSRAETLGLTYWDITPEHYTLQEQAQLESLRATGRYGPYEKDYIHRDGHLVPVQLSGVMIEREGEQFIWSTVEDITERKRSELALYESEERLRLAMETARMGAWDWNVAANSATYSHSLGPLFGLPPGVRHATVDEFMQAIHPEDRVRIGQALTLSLETDATFCEEYRIIWPDGSTHWLSDRGRVYRDQTGKSVRMIGVIANITEQKLAERKLRLTQFAVDHAMDAVYWVDSEAKIVGVNEAASLMLGYSADELCAMTVHDLSPDFPAALWPGFWTETQRRKAMTLDVFHRSKEGRLVPVELSINFHCFDGQELHCVIVRNSTERKQSQDELRRSHAFIRQIIDTDPNFIFAKDREGRFVLVNKALADAYGTTVEQLLGKTDADFNDNREEVAFFRQKDLSVMDSGQDLFIPEESITDSEGKVHWLQTVKRPILNEEGRADMVLGVATDITERKQMEQDLRAAGEERERISQDLHDGILQSLFAVGLCLEGANRLMAPRDRKAFGLPLDQAVGQLNQVIQGVRGFISGLGSDQFPGKDWLTELRLMLKSLTKNSPLQVRHSIESRAAQALSAEQASQLLYIVQEAVSNSLRHSGAQEARISLKMLKRGIRLSIRDNGRGFNPASVKGRGQGLTNMAARMQKMGGRLTVCSSPKSGTQILCDLPKEAFHDSR